MFGNGTTTYHAPRPAFSATGGRAPAYLDNDALAHAWAHMSQDWGRSGNGNFYFEGPALYSYGAHYIAGFRLLPDDGDRHGGVALLNADKSSISTERQKSHARAASRHMTQYHVPALTDLARYLPRSNRAPSEFEAGRIAAYVADNIRSLDTPAAVYLLNLSGQVRATVANVERMKAKAEAAAAMRAARKEADADKESREYGKRLIANFKDEPAVSERLADFAARVKRSGHTYDFDSLLKRARKAHKAHSKAGNVRLKAAIWQIVKRVDAERVAALSAWKAAHKNDTTRRKAKEFRRFAARHAAGERLAVYEFSQWAAACEWLLSYAPGLNRARAALSQTRLDICARHAEACEIERIERQAKREKEAAEKHAKQVETRRAWLAGETPRTAGYGLTDLKGRALVRAVGVTWQAGEIVAGTLETSMGASVPLLEAIKVFRMVKLCRERGQGWKRNGARLPVGAFQVDFIDAAGNFKAGCHDFSFDEIARLAALLNLSEIPAGDTTNHA